MSTLPSIYPLKPAPPKKRERRRLRFDKEAPRHRHGDSGGGAAASSGAHAQAPLAGLMDVGTWSAVRDSSGMTGEDMGGGEAEILQVQLWMQSFNNEKERFQSVAMCAELFWARVLGATSELPEPNILRTAACMILLEQVMCLFDRYGPLFKSLCAQLQTALFIDKATSGFSKTAAYRASGDPTLEDLLPRRYIRQTYFSAYREMQVRYAALEAQTASVQSNMNKLWCILDRSISAWQRVLVFQVFGLWRGVAVRQVLLRRKHTSAFRRNIKNQRIQTAWRNWCASIDEAKLQSAQKGASEVGTTVERLQAEVGKLKEQLKDCKYVSEAKDSRLSILVTENKKLKEEKAQAILKTVNAQKTCKRYAEMVGRWIASHQQPRFDWLARKRAESLLTHPYGTHRFLIEWANHIIAETCGSEGQISVNNFAEEVKTCKPYLYLLRALAPAHCSEGWVIRSLSEMDVNKRAATIMDACKKLQINTTLTAPDIVNGSHELNYIFLAQLFRRFATFAPAFIPPPQDETGLEEEETDDLALIPPSDAQEELELWDTSPNPEDLHRDTKAPQTPEEWDERWMRLQNMNRHWEARLALVQTRLEVELSEAIRRSNKPTVSKKQQAMQDEFAKVPMSGFLDVLTSMRGDYSPQETFVTVVKVLTAHHQLLRRVFRHYSMADAAAVSATGVNDDSILATMSFQQFSKFVADCGISDAKRDALPDLRTIADRVRNADSTGGGKRLMQKAPAHQTLVAQRLYPLEFSLALVYLAKVMYDDAELSDRLRRLIVDQVEPNAKASAADSFRDEVKSDAVQAVMKTHEKQLLEVFLRYYDNDSSVRLTGISQGSLAISLAGWKSFCQEQGLYDQTLTPAAAEATFFGVQGEEEDDSSLTMSFVEFKEALCAVCIYKYPNPFETLSQRLLRFFKERVFRG